MSKNLKTVYILMTIFASIILAWFTLSNFFNGVGLNFVAMLLILVALILLRSDKEVKSRTRDLFWLATIFTALEFLVYFIFEFQIWKAFRVFWIFQIVYTVLGWFLFAYIMVRLILDAKGIKVGLIEKILGNSVKTEKKSKPLTDNSLEEKPAKSELRINDEEDEVVYEDENDIEE